MHAVEMSNSSIWPIDKTLSGATTPGQFSQTVLIQPIQFSINFVFKQLNVKTVLFKKIEFSITTVSMSKTVPFQTIQLSLSTQFKCKYIV